MNDLDRKEKILVSILVVVSIILVLIVGNFNYEVVENREPREINAWIIKEVNIKNKFETEVLWCDSNVDYSWSYYDRNTLVLNPENPDRGSCIILSNFPRLNVNIFSNTLISIPLSW